MMPLHTHNTATTATHTPPYTHYRQLSHIPKPPLHIRLALQGSSLAMCSKMWSRPLMLPVTL